MDGLIAYVLAKKIALGAVSGLSGIQINGTDLIFNFNDGSSASMSIPLPKDGKDGITPLIDPITKHWIIGTNDTGIISEGKNGQDGISIVDIYIDENGHLITTLSNGKKLDAGKLPKPTEGEQETTKSSMVFVETKEELPTVGEREILYITNSSTFRWNGTEYVDLSSSTEVNIKWGEF